MIDEKWGMVFDIQRFCIHDGPGIRSVVFLKGCPLNCLWCHNPESNSSASVLSFFQQHCSLCGACVNACPNGVHAIIDGCHTLDRDKCQFCGHCINACRNRALDMIGRLWSVEEVFDELMRDARFYKTSGGGITISGGEPLLQTDFIAKLLKACKAAGFHCALETSGFASYHSFQKVLPYVDLFLFDVKETNPQKHIAFTGVDNGLILQNLHQLHADGAKILLRCPIVPGLNDREDHLKAIADMSKELDRCVGAELLPYHKFGVIKNQRIGKQAQNEYIEPDAETIEGWKAVIRKYNGRLVD